MKKQTTRSPSPNVTSVTPSSVPATTGRPLDQATRDHVEPRLRCDLTHVRVHSDAEAARSAQRMNAGAYTIGSHIVFAQNAYRPEHPIGRRLLFHELAHTAQQQRSLAEGGAEQRPTAGYAALESQADSIADRLASGSHVSPAEILPAPQIIQRAPPPSNLSEPQVLFLHDKTLELKGLPYNTEVAGTMTVDLPDGSQIVGKVRLDRVSQDGLRFVGTEAKGANPNSFTEGQSILEAAQKYGARFVVTSPAGTPPTSAKVKGLSLQPGDVIVFEEGQLHVIHGNRTGSKVPDPSGPRSMNIDAHTAGMEGRPDAPKDDTARFVSKKRGMNYPEQSEVRPGEPYDPPEQERLSSPSKPRTGIPQRLMKPTAPPGRPGGLKVNKPAADEAPGPGVDEASKPADAVTDTRPLDETPSAAVDDASAAVEQAGDLTEGLGEIDVIDAAGGGAEIAEVGDAVAVPVAELGLGAVAEAAVILAVQLFFSWLQEIKEKAEIESDLQTLEPQIEAELKKLEPEITRLQKLGKVYCRVRFEITHITEYLESGDTNNKYLRSVVDGVQVTGLDQGSSHSAYDEKVTRLSDNRFDSRPDDVIHHSYETVTILLDDPGPRVRKQENAKILATLAQMGAKLPPAKATPLKQPEPLPPTLPKLIEKETARPATPPSPAVAMFTPPTSSGQVQVDPDDVLSKARSTAAQVVAYGEWVSAWSPSESHRRQFKNAVTVWRLNMTAWINHFTDQGPAWAEDAMSSLLDDSVQGGARMRDLLAALGGDQL